MHPLLGHSPILLLVGSTPRLVLPLGQYLLQIYRCYILTELYSWNYYYTIAISIPVEVTALTILITFWDSNVRFSKTSGAISADVLIALAPSWIHGPILCADLLDQHLRCPLFRRVRIHICHFEAWVYQEVTCRCVINPSFFLSLVSLITGLIITGLVVDLGGGPDHDRRGFRVRISAWHVDFVVL